MKFENYKGITMVKLKSGRVYLCDLFATLAETESASKNRRIELLHDYTKRGADHELALRGFVECMYHPDVQFDLPPGIPPYEENKAPDPTFASFSLFKFFKERYPLYYATKSNRKIQNDIKRETLFVQNLEQLYKDEAKILLAMKDKTDKGLKYINEGLFRDAFPTWLPPKDQAAQQN